MLRSRLAPLTPILEFEHHLCHAASGFYASPYDRALVLTLDEEGDMWAGLIAIGEGTGLKAMRALPFPNSLGWLYSQVTELLGFRPGGDEHKTQWLSRCGSPEPDLIQVFRDVFRQGRHGLPVLDRRFLTADGMRWRLASSVAERLGLRAGVTPDRRVQAVIARSLQDFLEETVISVAEQYRQATATRHLCVAGGVFHNVLLVRALELRTRFESVFVQPVPGNHGTALGAIYLARQQMKPDSHRLPLTHLQLGPPADPQEIKEVLDNCKLVYSYFAREDQLLARTAALLRQHHIIAWHQDRMEFGFRALGNRSILASPFSPYVKDNLNHFVKHREDFHPFVLAVPAERAAEFFTFGPNCRFAASVGELRPGCCELEPLTFGGRQVRLHLVEAQTNPRFHALLRTFGETAPAPVLVSTSFNLFGEPLVCGPRDAVRSFYSAGIDGLVLGDFVVTK
jgi:carbamoyltransferase